ncbi:MAG TPA: hypothetical protein VND80_04405 [Steroidobacteraceae bacterium]|nr:hypothetical protein [Steroidobacteraceae bacterium]
MRIHLSVILLASVFAATAARADLHQYKDYTVSHAVWSITTVKVHANMRNAYLAGLKKTWVASMEVAKKLGQVENYHIYVSDLPQSGNFNMMLVAKFKDDAQLAPNKARYEAFMKAWGSERNKETNEIAQKDYPAMRKITGEYRMRALTMTK